MSPDEVKKLVDALSPGDEAEFTFGGAKVRVRKGPSQPASLPSLPVLPQMPVQPLQPAPAPWVDRTGYPWWRETIICTTSADTLPV